VAISTPTKSSSKKFARFQHFKYRTLLTTAKGKFEPACFKQDCVEEESRPRR
jgi:hypothetical protein